MLAPNIDIGKLVTNKNFMYVIVMFILILNNAVWGYLYYIATQQLSDQQRQVVVDVNENNLNKFKVMEAINKKAADGQDSIKVLKFMHFKELIKIEQDTLQKDSINRVYLEFK